MPVAHVTPEIVLVLGAAAIVLVALFTGRDRQWLGAPIALVTIAVAMVTLADLQASTNQTITFMGTWALDGATAWATHIILVATALVVGLCPEWFRTDHRHGELYALLLLSALGAVMMAGAADLMELIVGTLLSAVTGYTLAAYHRASPLSAEAGIKYFLIGGLTNPLLGLGAVLLFGLAGTTVYGELAGGLGSASSVVLVAAAALVAVGVAVELGAVPAHAWVPDVAEGAPAPSAAFLTVVPKVGAVVALARILSILPAEQVGWRPLAAVLAAVTMTLGNLAALWQDDVRRLLGWSSVSQAGYALMGVVAIDASDLGLRALLMFVLGYAVANLAAFGVITELRGRTRLEDYRGLAHERPWLAGVLVVSFLSLVGIPPLVGFVGKWTLFAATIDAGYVWLAVLAVVNSVVSLFYYLRVLGPAYFVEADGPIPVLGRWARTSTLVAGAGVIVLGIAAGPILDAFSTAVLLP